MSTTTETTPATPRRVTFNSSLKQSEGNFKLMVKVLTHLAGAVEGQTFEGLWEQVSSKPVDYYRRHFRRENKRSNPLAGVKRPRTAYTFFTSERRNAIKESNPDKSFGEISQLLAVEWHALSEKKRAAYVKREQADKARYETAKAEITVATAETTAEPVEDTHEPVEDTVESAEETPESAEETSEPVSKRSSSPPAKKAKSASKPRKPAAKKSVSRK